MIIFDILSYSINPDLEYVKFCIMNLILEQFKPDVSHTSEIPLSKIKEERVSIAIKAQQEFKFDIEPMGKFLFIFIIKFR